MRGVKFEQLDALRFIAVLSVLVSHFHMFGMNEASQNFLGANGVNLFFVISGFLITLGLIRSKENEHKNQTVLLKFYVRRFLRIVPVYYLLLLVQYLFNHKRVADGILWYLSYTTNFYCIKIQDWGGLSHLWSLSIEEQFYFVWPFVILFVPKRFLLFAILSSVICSISLKALWLIQGASFWVLYMNPFMAIDTLAIGGLLAYLYHFHQNRLSEVLSNWIFISFSILQVLLFIIFSHKDSFEYTVFYRFAFGIFFFLIIGKVVFGVGGKIGRILLFKPFLYIGKISYGIYLFHIIVPGMMMGVKYPPEETFFRFCMYFSVTVAIASFSWYFVENPILKFKEKFD
jgi:peptidoglycan/LPS O-acetylase OafA/YrhL